MNQVRGLRGFRGRGLAAARRRTGGFEAVRGKAATDVPTPSIGRDPLTGSCGGLALGFFLRPVSSSLPARPIAAAPSTAAPSTARKLKFLYASNRCLPAI